MEVSSVCVCHVLMVRVDCVDKFGGEEQRRKGSVDISHHPWQPVIDLSL